MWKRAIFAAIVVSLMGAAAYASFFIAPTERTMGTLQRIFYFHAAAAWAGMTARSVTRMIRVVRCGARRAISRARGRVMRAVPRGKAGVIAPGRVVTA